MNIDIKKVSRNDISRIVEIETQCFSSDNFSRRQFLYLLNSKNSFFLVAVSNNIILGYIILLKRKYSNKLRIYSIAVDVDSRGLNVATSLIKHAENKAKELMLNEITLEVSEKNIPAYKLYLKNNFIAIGRKKQYYKDGSDALIMKKIKNYSK